MYIPPILTQGDSAALFFDAITDQNNVSYSSGTHGLTFAINGKGLATPVTVTATASGSGWKVSLTTAQTAGLPAGKCGWWAYATATGVRVQLYNGTFDVKADPTTASATFEHRSKAEQIVDAIDAYMLSQATGNQIDIVEYAIRDRHLKKDRAGLETLRAYYSKIVAGERASQQMANGLGNPRRSLTRFAEPH